MPEHRGLLRRCADFARSKQLQAELFAAAIRARPGGVDLERRNSGNDPLVATAVLELLRKHPELTIVKFKSKLTLAFRNNVEGTISEPCAKSLNQANLLLRGDNTPNVEALVSAPKPGGNFV